MSAMTAIAATWCLLTPAPLHAGDLDFPPSDFTLRSIDGRGVIGHAHAGVTTGSDGLTTLHGENHFNDGSYDIDEAVVREGVDGGPPLLVRSHHSFFLANGSPDRESRTDIAAGIGECTVYVDGAPQVSREKFDFPPDTFAGETVMIPLRRFLNSGAGGTTSFHDFNCVPDPKLLKVTAVAQPPAPWNFYPGNLVRIDVKPDFGWINVLIAPFLPQIRAWFDPGNGWLFVGGESARYYKGLKFLMVRERPVSTEIRAGHGPAPDDDPTTAPQAQPTPRPQPAG
jgi:hypothetical protein